MFLNVYATCPQQGIYIILNGASRSEGSAIFSNLCDCFFNTNKFNFIGLFDLTRIIDSV